MHPSAPRHRPQPPQQCRPKNEPGVPHNFHTLAPPAHGAPRAELAHRDKRGPAASGPGPVCRELHKRLAGRRGDPHLAGLLANTRPPPPSLQCEPRRTSHDPVVQSRQGAAPHGLCAGVSPPTAQPPAGFVGVTRLHGFVTTPSRVEYAPPRHKHGCGLAEQPLVQRLQRTQPQRPPVHRDAVPRANNGAHAPKHADLPGVPADGHVAHAAAQPPPQPPQEKVTRSVVHVGVPPGPVPPAQQRPEQCASLPPGSYGNHDAAVVDVVGGPRGPREERPAASAHKQCVCTRLRAAATCGPVAPPPQRSAAVPTTHRPLRDGVPPKPRRLLAPRKQPPAQVHRSGHVQHTPQVRTVAGNSMPLCKHVQERVPTPVRDRHSDAVRFLLLCGDPRGAAGQRNGQPAKRPPQLQPAADHTRDGQQIGVGPPRVEPSAEFHGAPALRATRLYFPPRHVGAQRVESRAKARTPHSPSDDDLCGPQFRPAGQRNTRSAERAPGSLVQ